MSGRLASKYQVWSVDSNGRTQQAGPWVDADTLLREGYEDVFLMDLNGDGITGMPALADEDKNGLADNLNIYSLVRGAESIVLKDKRGRVVSDESSRYWNAVKSVANESGFDVLIAGVSGRIASLYRVWSVDIEGRTEQIGRWMDAKKMLQEGYEDLFAIDLNSDGITGMPAVVDEDSDGFADGLTNYGLVRGAESIDLRDKRGRLMSSGSSHYWNAVKSVANESGFDVLIAGVSGRLASKYQVWSVDIDGRTQQARRWADAETLLREGYEDVFAMDLNADGIIGMPALVDEDSDGFADGFTNYALLRGAELIDLKDRRGRVLSESSSRYWNAVKSVGNESGFDVLIEGVGGQIVSKYQVWSVDIDGRTEQTGRWMDAKKMLQEGYEDLFAMDLNGDGITGMPAVVDEDADGFADGLMNYGLVRGVESIDLRDKRGRVMSDSSSRFWNAVKSVGNESGFDVLIEGVLGRIASLYQVWSVDSDGVTEQTGSWINPNTLLREGYEDVFAMDLNGDGITGMPADIDEDKDGFADGFTNYALVRGAELIDLKDRRGRVLSESSSRYWNAVKSVGNESGFEVLIEGVSGLIGSKYQVWTVDSDGVTEQTGRWMDMNTMFQEGYEDLFGMDLNRDGIVGLPPVEAG